MTSMEFNVEEWEKRKGKQRGGRNSTIIKTPHVLSYVEESVASNTMTKTGVLSLNSGSPAV